MRNPPSPLTKPLAILLTLPFLLAGCGTDPQESFTRGQAMLAEGNTQGAIIELKTTLQALPDHKEARLALARAHLEEDNFPEAEKELRKALELGGAPETIVPDLARSLLRQGNAEGVLALEPPAGGMTRAALASLHATRAEAFMQLNRSVDAQQALVLAEQADPGQPDLLLLQARISAVQERFAEALEKLDAVLAQRPRQLDALYVKAAIQEAQGQLAEAIQTYQTALSIRPRAYRAHLAIADLEFRRGRPEQGSQALQAAERIAPGAPFVVYARGIHELRNNNLPAANDALLKFLSTVPNYAPAQLASAIVNLGLGNFEQSLKAAQQVLAQEPENQLAMQVVAASQIKTGDPARALATLRPLLDAGVSNPAVLALAGEAHYHGRNYQQALANLQRAGAMSPESPEIRALQAASLAALGKEDMAVQALEEAARLSPEAGRADIALIRLHLQRENHDEALRVIAQLERKLPANAFTHNLRALALLGKQDRAGARRALEQGLRQDPAFFLTVANLARIDIADGQLAVAKQRVEAFLARNENHLPAMLALAEMANLANQEREHVAWLERAAAAHPGAEIPRMLLARHYLAQQQPERAVSVAQAAVRANAGSPHALDLLGTTQLAANDPGAAVATFRELTRQAPNSPEAHLRLGVALTDARQFGEARAALSRAMSLRQGYTAAKDALWRLELAANNPRAALEWAERIQAHEPRSPLGFDRAGDVHLNQRRFAEAARAYQQAQSRDGGNRFLLKAADALARAGDAQAALSLLQPRIQSHPRDLAVRSKAATLAVRVNRADLAIAQLEEVVRQNPRDGWALNNLATLYQDKNGARALQLAAQAYQLLPREPQVQDTYGWILLAQGQDQKALDLLGQAARGAPTNPTIRFHHATALAKTGRRAEARAALETLLAEHPRFDQAQAARALLASVR